MSNFWTWLTKPATGPGSPFERDGFCAIRTDMDRWPKCKGCRRIEALIRYCDEHLPRGSRSRPVCFHNSYHELDFCAEKCATCRVIRRGFLLNQATTTQVEELGAHAHQVPVWATMEKGRLRVSLQGDEGSFCPLNKQVELLLGPPDGVEVRALPTLVSEDRVCAEIQGWARACESHPQCGNLNWSRKNPTRLIRILSDSHIQIVDSRHIDFVQYVALSYCWGSSEGADTRTVKANIVQRKKPFPTADLRKSIQHAIVLTRRIGLHFIWVDSACIVQDSNDDWAREAMLMAEVYSNAYFTMCSVSAEHADAALIRPRDAWTYPVELCYLAGQRLSIISLPLNELKRLATYSTRAWTLQEERLSPRILYWTPQRMYWSCTTQRFTESSQLQRRLITGEAPDTTQAFLRASRDGIHLHPYWKDVVEDYTERSLTNPEDRFPALSGLAARYQLPRGSNEYLAGLWQQTIAEDLAWHAEVPSSCNRLEERARGIPSWSWASLPICIPAKMSRNWQGCDSFSFIGSRSQLSDFAEIRRIDSDAPKDIGLAEIRKGAQVTAITVRARMRPLLRAGHERRSWSDVKSRMGTDEMFTFERFVDRHIYCLEPSRWQVLVYEPRRREIVYQLDYLIDDEQLMSRIDGFQCLELGQHSMLLVERCRGGATADDSIESYQRVGISIGLSRPDFFNDAATKTYHLV
ncbi:heterokaryon incompatibility protein-domain-containing protein [Xylariaceae sp. AK1471]|nr:heterokaryon incompatibility protein-domain-containing protein [Xylariaceae sp. AK1471]